VTVSSCASIRGVRHAASHPTMRLVRALFRKDYEHEFATGLVREAFPECQSWAADLIS
jgi:hypothetical protein